MSEDVSVDVIMKTQKTLGRYVRKPPLTEKLLRKPPFRFLHDIIITVVKETNYLKGLFTEDELNSEKVKEKEAKIAFLNKLIEAVKNTTKTDLPVRSSKIVAGLESANTNLLLQAIGTALESNVDSSSYVDKIKSENGTTGGKKVKKTTSTTKEEKIKSHTKSVKEELKIPKSKHTDGETPKTKKMSNTAASDSSRKKDSRTKKSKDDGKKQLDQKQVANSREKMSSKEKISPKSNGSDSCRNTKADKEGDNFKTENGKVKGITDNAQIDSNEVSKDQSIIIENGPDETPPEPTNIVDQMDINQVESLDSEDRNRTNNSNKDIMEPKNEEYNRGTVMRPKSARPRSGENRILSAPRQNVVLPKNDTDPSNNISASQQNNPAHRPRSSLRPPSVRPSSARPGAPRLRPDSAVPAKESVTMGNINVIVENVDMADDEETVVIETVSEASKDDAGTLEVSSDNKGQLVEQILEQIAEEEDGKSRNTEIDWENEGFRGKDGTHKEVSNLRDLIQRLTKTANPLGKLINYLHEDIDAMHNELQIWSNTKRQLSDEIIKQKKISLEANKPLIAHLDQLQHEIEKQRQEIIITHSNILRNDMRIEELTK